MDRVLRIRFGGMKNQDVRRGSEDGSDSGMWNKEISTTLRRLKKIYRVPHGGGMKECEKERSRGLPRRERQDSEESRRDEYASFAH
jgi:hypothetical protein